MAQPTFLFLGDGTTISENNNYQVLSMLRKKRILDQRFCHEMEYIEETYRCVSGLFYKAREEVMKEICYKLENGRFDTNLDVPFEMLFQRNSSFFGIRSTIQRKSTSIQNIPSSMDLTIILYHCLCLIRAIKKQEDGLAMK